MKSMKMALIALLLIGFFSTHAKAQDRGVNGLLLGAGGGALVGQAIGRDTEGTLIGTAVGGMLGYMAGNEMDKEGYRGNYSSPQSVGYYPSSPPPQMVVYPPPPPPQPRYYSSRPYYGDHYRRDYRPDQDCREIMVVKERHGRYRQTVTTVCRDRGDWRDDHRRHRDWYRHDRYIYNDRW